MTNDESTNDQGMTNEQMTNVLPKDLAFGFWSSFTVAPMLFTRSLRVFPPTRRKDLVNNSAPAVGTRSLFRSVHGLSNEAFTHRPMTNAIPKRSTFMTKPSRRAVRLALDECSRMKRSGRFTVKVSRGPGQRESDALEQ
jgi:hypothetical protein